MSTLLGFDLKNIGRFTISVSRLLSWTGEGDRRLRGWRGCLSIKYLYINKLAIKNNHSTAASSGPPRLSRQGAKIVHLLLSEIKY